MSRFTLLLAAIFSPISLLAQQINWSWANRPIPSGTSYGIAAYITGGPAATVTIYKNGGFFAQGNGGTSNSSYDVGPTTVTYHAVASGYPDAYLYVTIEAPLSQAAVSSQNKTLTYGQTFVPDFFYGSGTGNWQYCIGGSTDLPNNSGAGTQYFGGCDDVVLDATRG